MKSLTESELFRGIQPRKKLSEMTVDERGIWMKELNTEERYRFFERLGSLIGREHPTLEQLDIAQGDVNRFRDDEVANG